MPTASSLAKKVDDHYNHLSSLQAHYVEHYAGMGMDRTESGTLLLKKPGRMRWSYEANNQPTGKLFVLDGKNGWFYSPGDAQAQKIPAKQLDDLRSPLRFLLGHTQLEKELDHLTLTPASADFHLSGVPAGMAQRVKDLSLTVNAAGVIEGIRMEELDGAVTEFTFAAIHENIPVPNDAFVFIPPAGVTIVNGLPPILTPIHRTMMDLVAMSQTTQSVLTTGDFYAQVHALSPRIAVFDCDGTLWPGDSGSGFMRWTIETGLLSRESSNWMDEHYRLYCKGEIGELDICGQMVQVYRGLRALEMRAAAAKYFSEHVEHTIFPEMRQLIADLQHAGTDIWAVSSTNNWVVEEGVKRFNIPANRVLAACVEVQDGIVTETLRDIPSDEGKVASLRRNHITAPDAVFGNSIHDAAMLSIARRAFPVNPTPALIEYSAQRTWPVYYPAAMSPGDPRCTIPNG